MDHVCLEAHNGDLSCEVEEHSVLMARLIMDLLPGGPVTFLDERAPLFGAFEVQPSREVFLERCPNLAETLTFTVESPMMVSRAPQTRPWHHPPHS